MQAADKNTSEALLAPVAQSSSPHAAAPEGAGTPFEFSDVYANYFAFVWRCLQGLGVPREQLDDLTQETFFVVYRRLAEYQPAFGLRAWLFGILRMVARNQRRGQLRKLKATTRLEHEPAEPQKGPHDALVASQARDLLFAFLDTLEESRREVFYLSEIEDLPAPELAQALNIPLNTAYSRLRRARADLDVWLKDKGVNS